MSTTMSSLQMGLAAAGGLLLVGVVAHGAWNARRNAPRQAQPEPPTADPPDTDSAQRREPSLDDELALPSSERYLALDPLIDVIAPLALESPMDGALALAALPTTRRVGSKPFAIEGLQVQTRQWEGLRAGQRYSGFQAGVQLANRSGALNEIEFSEFVVKVQSFADAINATPEFPDMVEEVARARELDQFAGSHDAQISFTVRAARTAWSPGYVQQHAARLGFVPGLIPGRMMLPAAQTGTPPLLGLLFDGQAALAEDPAQSALREISLTLDIPQVERSEQAFARLREISGALAQTMDGIVTDDHGRVLADVALDAIAGDLEHLYQALEARDFAAGSALARRLFS